VEGKCPLVHSLDLAGRRLRIDEPLRAGRLRERAVAGDVVAAIRLELDVRDRDVGAGACQRQGIGPAEAAAPTAAPATAAEEPAAAGDGEQLGLF
jgi:hypothetical protein